MCIRDRGVFGDGFFLEFKQRVADNYPELFTIGEPDYSATGTFGAKWGWYQSIFGLAQGDVTRFENITKLNMHECLYALEFMKEKNELEAKRIKRNG